MCGLCSFAESIFWAPVIGPYSCRILTVCIFYIANNLLFTITILLAPKPMIKETYDFTLFFNASVWCSSL